MCLPTAHSYSNNVCKISQLHGELTGYVMQTCECAGMLTPRVLATAQVQTIQSTAASLHTAIPSGLTGVPNARDLAEAYPTLRPGE